MKSRGIFKCVQATALLLSLSAPAAARAYLVGLGGSGNGCTHSSIGAAITAAANNPGPDEIRLIQGMTDSEQAIEISGQDLTITGGYENCGDPDVELERTVVSGLGGIAAPVFKITGPGVVRLENLHILSGDSPISGGGISYTSSALIDSVNALVLTRTVLDANTTTNDGGGVFFWGRSNRTADLILEQDTGFFRNIAAVNGGAIHIQGNALLSGEAQRLFFWDNSAQTGSGGALHVVSPANAVIGSATWLGDATFLGNRAELDGGAIHVDASTTTDISIVRLYSFLPNQPLVLDANVAGRYGGAISVVGNAGNNIINAGVCARNINLLRNVALDGAALRATKGEYGYCQGIAFPASADIACAPRSLCGRISANQSDAASPNASVVRLLGAFVDMRDTQLRDNVVTRRAFHIGDVAATGGNLGSRVLLRNSLVVGNHFTDAASEIFWLTSRADLTLNHVTVADNTPILSIVEAAQALEAPGLTVRDSILYQPGSTAVSALPGATLDHVLLGSSQDKGKIRS